MSDFVPNEIIICDNRDPPWMKRFIKYLILYKANFYKTFERGKNSMFHLLTFHNLQNHLTILKWKNCVLFNSVQECLVGCF